MDVHRFQRARALFERAQELAETERGSYLGRECGADEQLREDVERLLGASPRAEFLDPPRALAVENLDALPERIGNYRLLAVIGCGGMGVVYAAEQAETRRRVALKVLRVALADEVTAQRFRLEAELLGRLDHPGIARVYEAGVHREADGGQRPFIALEFVEEARTILEHARHHRLDPLARMALFRQIVEAVQAGHQQGIVHRDLKPDNVIVGKQGVPKVIDFGVARWLEEEGTRRTLSGAFIGTPAYMAPEQFDDGAGGADTRTDVYALGLIAYELFYESRPYDLDRKSLTAIARTVLDAPLRRPANASRRESPDLWWVISRALAKEPERRYATAAELAADVRRLQRHEPVEAGPPDARYRLRKFVRRHRVLVGAVAFAGIALGIGAVVALLGLLRARDENTRFRAINRVFEDVLTGARDDALGPGASATALIDRAARRLEARVGMPPDVEAPIRVTLARAYLDLGADAAGESQARRALELYVGLDAPADPRHLEAAYLLGVAAMRGGRREEARGIVEAHRSAWSTTEPTEARSVAISFGVLDIELLAAAGATASALDAARGLHEQVARALGPEHEQVTTIEERLAELLRSAGRPHESLEAARRVAEARIEKYGERSAPAISARLAVIQAQIELQRDGSTIDDLRRLADDAREVYGPEHPDTLTVEGCLATSLYLADRSREAADILERIVDMRQRAHLGDQHALLLAQSMLARCWADLADPRAEELLREVIARGTEVFGAAHPQAWTHRFHLGRLLRRARRFEEAETELQAVLAARREQLGENHLDTIEALQELAMLAIGLGAFDEADRRWREARPPLEEALGADHERCTRAAWNHGYTILQLGRHDEAFAILEGALVRLRSSTQGREAELSGYVHSLAVMNARAGRLDRFEELAADARSLAAGSAEARSPQVIDMISQHAQTLVDAGRHATALPLLEDLVLHPELAEASTRGLSAVHLRALGTCLRAEGRGEEALERWFEGLRLDATRLGQEHEAVRRLVEDMRSLARELGCVEASEARIEAVLRDVGADSN